MSETGLFEHSRSRIDVHVVYGEAIAPSTSSIREAGDTRGLRAGAGPGTLSISGYHRDHYQHICSKTKGQSTSKEGLWASNNLSNSIETNLWCTLQEVGTAQFKATTPTSLVQMAHSIQALPLLLALLPLALPEQTAYIEKDGGWLLNHYSPLQEEERCTVERRDASITYREFMQWYAYTRPVIIRGITDNSAFRSLCTKQHLLEEFGERQVRLSTANTYSYEKDTLYFFGDNNFTEWGSLFQKYTPPPFQIPGTSGAYSFGIAGSGTGVPFHWHGPGFSEIIYGRKRWFLYPPEKTPEFNPNRTTLSWLMDTYPFLSEEERPVECTIRPGEVLYFPDRWWHATLNLDTSVFISTFLG
ncbi:jmjC domain-containing protein 8 isoform X2 [Ascaphus truei]|uniref:jmjC domain-containing protein 8 isoform X2 n=1 Tax=Ascaphus truei TaxID=8439 RepID=UPI003F590B32